MTITCKYRKFADGTWGVIAPAAIASGTVVTVRTNAGAEKSETIEGLHGTEGAAFLYLIKPREKNGQRATAAVGDMAGVLALFARAAQHIKKPNVVIAAGGLDITLSIATARAQVPGSINVVDSTDPQNGRWLGRILAAGTFEASFKHPCPGEVVEQLVRLAAKPAEVATEYGRLTGRCSFCNVRLSDEEGRSQAVGYGRTCARNYGLPWGKARHNFAVETVAASADDYGQPGGRTTKLPVTYGGDQQQTMEW